MTIIFLGFPLLPRNPGTPGVFLQPNRDVKINNLELGALLIQILIFPPRMTSLEHIHTYAYSTAAQGWSNRGSVSTASFVGPILQEIVLAARHQNIHASVRKVSGEENEIADATLKLTHLPDCQFLSHFCTHLPQSKSWSLLPLPSVCKRKLTKILYKKRSPWASLPPFSRNTPPPGANGGASAAGCKSPPISQALNTPFHYSKFLPSASVLDFCLRKVSPLISNWWSNTSAPLV